MTMKFPISSCSHPNTVVPSYQKWIHPMEHLSMVSIFEGWITWQCVCNNIYFWNCKLRFSLFDYLIVDSLFQIRVSVCFTARPMWTEQTFRFFRMVNYSFFSNWIQYQISAGCTVNGPSENYLAVPRIFPNCWAWLMISIFCFAEMLARVILANN